jgi:hypothetical protein
MAEVGGDPLAKSLILLGGTTGGSGGDPPAKSLISLMAEAEPLTVYNVVIYTERFRKRALY